MKRDNKPYFSSDSLRNIIRENNMLLMTVSRFNIPFGFGDASISKICSDHNVDADTFLAVCNLLSNDISSPSGVSLPSLMGYLRRAHSSFIDITLPRIRQHLIEAINYNEADELSIMLIRFYDNYVKEVKRHTEYENNVIFSYVENLLDGKCEESRRIKDLSANHGHMAEKLQELKDLFIYHYDQAENTRLSASLFDIIICEKDLMAHFEVENRLFIPAVEILEKKLSRNNATKPKEDTEESDSPANLLGEREKEILRLIAKGRSNKEIADELCISIHTVATHRRNISAKLDIHSAAGLTIFAIIHKIVKIEDVNPL